MHQLNVQHLFIYACLLKLLAAFGGWLLHAPWLLGFALPLLLMAGYVWLGATRRDPVVGTEKFADSCFHLGFIFTLASISVALMDLPDTGVRVQDIALRFGAAMLSTVAGLSVRVVLLTFRHDLAESVEQAQAGVLASLLRFREQLNTALGSLAAFDVAVHQAAQRSVERVNLQIEALSKNHAERLAQFFAALAKGNREVFAQALDAIQGASVRLSDSVDSGANALVLALDALRDRARGAEAALASIGRLTEQQQLLADGAQRQVDQLGQLDNTLQWLDKTLGDAVAGLERASNADAQLRAAMRSLVLDNSATRDEVRERLGQIAGELLEAIRGLRPAQTGFGARLRRLLRPSAAPAPAPTPAVAPRRAPAPASVVPAPAPAPAVSAPAPALAVSAPAPALAAAAAAAESLAIAESPGLAPDPSASERRPAPYAPFTFDPDRAPAAAPWPETRHADSGPEGDYFPVPMEIARPQGRRTNSGPKPAAPAR